MAYMCDKNLSKRTVLLQLIIKTVVTCFFLEHSVYALLLAIDVVRRSKENNFVIFSDSMLSLQSISGFNLESDLVQKFLKDYTLLAKKLFYVGFLVMWESSVMKKQMQLQNRHSPYLSLVRSFLPPACILV